MKSTYYLHDAQFHVQFSQSQSVRKDSWYYNLQCEDSNLMSEPGRPDRENLGQSCTRSAQSYETEIEDLKKEIGIHAYSSREKGQNTPKRWMSFGGQTVRRWTVQDKKLDKKPMSLSMDSKLIEQLKAVADLAREHQKQLETALLAATKEVSELKATLSDDNAIHKNYKEELGIQLSKCTKDDIPQLIQSFVEKLCLRLRIQSEQNSDVDLLDVVRSLSYDVVISLYLGENESLLSKPDFGRTTLRQFRDIFWLTSFF